MRNALLASINLAAFLLGCSFLTHAIALARWRQRGSVLVIFLIVLCGQIWLIPQAISFFGFHSTRFLYPVWFGNWIVLPFGVILFCQKIHGSSRDLSDAALLDGAGSLTTLGRVVWPMMKPALIALAFLLTMATWTEFAGSLVGIELTGDLRADKFPKILLGSLLATLPTIAIFLWARRAFLRGMNSRARVQRS